MMPSTHHGKTIGLWVLLSGGCMQVPEPLEIEGLYDEDGKPWAAEAAIDDLGPGRYPDEPFGHPADSRLGRSPWDDVEHDYSTWPLSSDPDLAAIGMREPRTHALWPTPITEPCAAVMFANLGPELTGGDMFDRTASRIARIEPPRLGLGLTELFVLRDHVDVPGLRLVTASSSPGVCMMAWSHMYCFVDAHDVYCPDGTLQDLERLVRVHRLEPRSLSKAGWLELAVVMTDVDTVVIDASLADECTWVKGASALPPEVIVGDDVVVVRFTSVDGDRGVDRELHIERGGRARMKTTPRWSMPAQEP